jgi:hypothetical protein
MKIRMLVIVAAVAVLTGCTETPKEHMGAAVDNDQNVLTGGPITGTTIDDLPSAVKETLKERVPRAEIATIDKTRRNGRTVYEFNFAEPDKTPMLYVRKDGVVVPAPTSAER